MPHRAASPKTTGIACPHCGACDTTVKRTEHRADCVWRRRVCQNANCGRRVITFEMTAQALAKLRQNKNPV